MNSAVNFSNISYFIISANAIRYCPTKLSLFCVFQRAKNRTFGIVERNRKLQCKITSREITRGVKNLRALTFVSTQLLESTQCPKSYLTGSATPTVNSNVNFFIN